jgi:hypothetical protein
LPNFILEEDLGFQNIVFQPEVKDVGQHIICVVLFDGYEEQMSFMTIEIIDANSGPYF